MFFLEERAGTEITHSEKSTTPFSRMRAQKLFVNPQSAYVPKRRSILQNVTRKAGYALLCARMKIQVYRQDLADRAR